MNVAQGKSLLAAASQALALLDPDWPTAKTLKAVIAQATIRVTPQSKKIPVNQPGSQRWNGTGKFKDEEDFRAFCKHMQARWRHTGLSDPSEPRKLTTRASRDAGRVQREAEMERLRHCACTHTAEHHRQDERDNLLECDMPHCACEQFHYQTQQAA